MDMETRRQRVAEFNGIIERAIVQYQDVLGPQECEVHGPQIDDCDDECNINAVAALLRTWVLLFGWELADGEHTGYSVPDYFLPSGSMVWETIGLMQCGMDRMRGLMD